MLLPQRHRILRGGMAVRGFSCHICDQKRSRIKGRISEDWRPKTRPRDQRSLATISDQKRGRSSGHKHDQKRGHISGHERDRTLWPLTVADAAAFLLANSRQEKINSVKF